VASALIAIAAYLIGGCAYQRTVMHQRGWRQCPNYSLWAGMFGFIKVSIQSLVSVLLFPFSICRGRVRYTSDKGTLPVSRLD